MFDAIVIGSGMSGAIAAKELCERGLKTLVLERGRHLTHRADYTDMLQPWELTNANRVAEDVLERDYPVQRLCYAMSEATRHLWVKDSEHPYSTPENKPFHWIRGYHLGGRSIMWGRQTYRLSDLDFSANARDGHGVDWPIRYADIAPWYDHIEHFIGVSGSRENLAQLPDGDFLPPFGLMDPELAFKEKVAAAFPERHVIPGRCAHLTEVREHHAALGRAPCQVRSLCERGCSFGAYYSSLSGALPAAEQTGNLTVVTDAIVHSLETDPQTGRIKRVRVIDANTRAGRTYEARVVFLCASAIASAQILLNSRSEQNPNGLANTSDQVGRNLMDHLYGLAVVGTFPGFDDRTYRGRRPTGLYIPRYRNIDEQADFLRGYGYQGGAFRSAWTRVATSQPGIGAELKARVRKPGPWSFALIGFGEMLPYAHNRVSLHEARTDRWGVPIVHIDCSHGDNERKLAQHVLADAREMLTLAGATITYAAKEPAAPGLGIHEMGTARMGKDPRTSVLNQYNQAHDVPNLFITDGSAMTSSACQNPSLTYMALSARAAHFAVEFLKSGAV